MSGHTPTRPGPSGALVAGRVTAFKPTIEDLRHIWNHRMAATFMEKIEYSIGFDEFLDDLRAGRVEL